MIFPLYIAKRYLLAKKSHNAINIISIISVVVISIVSAALIIILSAFNGLEEIVDGMYGSYDCDLKITIKKGKHFHADSLELENIKNVEGVKYVTPILEGNALAKCNTKQYPAVIKGISEEYLKVSGLDTCIYVSDKKLVEGDYSYALMSYNVATVLNAYLKAPVTIYSPKKGYNTNLSLDAGLNRKTLSIGGIFSNQLDIEDSFIFIPLKDASKLFETDGKISSIEIGALKGYDIETIQSSISKIIGNDYLVKNRYQFPEREMVYKIFKSEKLAGFSILIFILIIAVFNVIGSISMLIIDKKHDVRVLQSLGATTTLIKRIFMIEGMLISLLGVLSGLFLGTILCFLQQEFGFISIDGGGNTILSHYPIKLLFADFVQIFFIVIVISLIAGWYPVKLLSKRYLS